MIALLLAACAAPPPAPPAALPASEPALPYALVLGTAQDGGLPQIGCELSCCTTARADGSQRRLVTSLLIVDPRSGGRWLIDATPDLPEQVERAAGHPPGREARAEGVRAGGRPPLFDGVFLTHAHMGHYTGLLQLGREAYGTRGLPVHGSPRMTGFLRSNHPWQLLVDTEQILPSVLEFGGEVVLGEDLTITAIPVPHRDEITDTVAFVVAGPQRSLLYLPDIDKWKAWTTPIEEVLADVDVALLDGSFYADGEIPGRSMADIPHPFISESIARFASLPVGERAKVLFTHLNHTNPAANPDSEAAAAVRAAGHAVAYDGQVLDL